jgi:hypothetical protein
MYRIGLFFVWGGIDVRRTNQRLILTAKTLGMNLYFMYIFLAMFLFCDDWKNMRLKSRDILLVGRCHTSRAQSVAFFLRDN